MNEITMLTNADPLIRMALAEDITSEDISTNAVMREAKQGEVDLICKEDGITAIVSLHQLEYARRFADRVVGLADSQIVFDAAPSELTDAQLERIYAGRSTTQPANAPAEPPVMLEPSLEMSR